MFSIIHEALRSVLGTTPAELRERNDDCSTQYAIVTVSVVLVNRKQGLHLEFGLQFLACCSLSHFVLHSLAWEPCKFPLSQVLGTSFDRSWGRRVGWGDRKRSAEGDNRTGGSNRLSTVLLELFHLLAARDL